MNDAATKHSCSSYKLALRLSLGYTEGNDDDSDDDDIYVDISQEFRKYVNDKRFFSVYFLTPQAISECEVVLCVVCAFCSPIPSNALTPLNKQR